MSERIRVTGPGWSAAVDVDTSGGEPVRRSIAISGDGTDVGVGVEMVHGVVVEFGVQGDSVGTPFETDGVSIPVTLMVEPGAAAGTAVDVAGSIDYRGPIVDGLLRLLGLDQVEDEIAGDVPTISLHPSGYTVLAAKQLPWEDAPLPGRFLVAMDGESRVTLEQEVLEETQQEAWLHSWRRFATAINPGNPLLRRSRGETAPAWLTLEATSVTEVPAISWTDATPGGVTIGPGAVRVLLTEESPYRPQRAGSVAILEPSTVTVAATADGVRVGAGTGEMVDNDRRLYVTATRPASEPGDAWNERMVLDTASLEPDPVLLAARLRAQQRDRGRSDVGCLTASTILDTGLVEIPVVDVTEQVLVDAGIEPAVQAASGAVRGAVVIGNQADRRVGEHPWSMTFSGAPAFIGRFDLVGGADGSLALLESAIEICDPSVVVNGMWWVATGSPGSADNLPLSDDWVAPYRSEPLYGGAGAGRRRPSGLTFGAIIQIVRDRDRAVFDGPQELACFPSRDTLDLLRSAYPDAPYFQRERFPTVWLTHPSLPVIQALPMTQVSRPANTPVRSRSLFPYQTKLRSDWRLVVQDIHPSRSWGHVDPAAFAPSADWASMTDLPMVFLSLPGLVSEPAGPGRAARLSYRHDLPTMDEITALTSTGPRRSSDGGSPRDAYWRDLSTRARLAAVQAATAFEIASEGGAERVEGREPVTVGVDPITQPVEIDLLAYPGTIVVGGAAPSLDIGRPDSPFDPLAGFMSMDSASEVVGGSERLRSNGAGLTDQFGVTRGETTRHNGHLQTDVIGADGMARRLVTTVEPIVLTTMGSPWELWLRDLPMMVDGSEMSFTRDPGGPFQGYEWRLGDGPLLLCGLSVLPVELRSFTRAGGGAVKIEVAARLTLPAGSQSNRPATAPDVVTLEFRAETSGDPIGLSAVRIDDPGTEAVWPMSVGEGGVIGGGPVISWREVSLDGTDLVVTGASGSGPAVEFFAFDRRWAVAMDEPLRFGPAGGSVDVSIPGTGGTLSGAGSATERTTPRIEPTAVRLTIALDGSPHRAELEMVFDADDVVITSTVDLTGSVLGSSATSIGIFGQSWSVEADHAVRSAIGSTGFEVSWDAAGAEVERSLLPGITVDGADIGGYASFVFEASRSEPVPVFSVTSAVTEMVLRGRGVGRTRADVTAGYIASIGAGGWERSLTVSGWITAENAFTFPFQDDDDVTTAPAPTPFGHIEHTATVVLDQHVLPTSWLRGEVGETFSRQVVVEHRLVVDDDVAPRGERSFVLNQSVRFASPVATAEHFAARSSDPHADEAGVAGPLHPEVAPRLIAALDALDPAVLVIDATVAAWVDTSNPVDGPMSMVTVQYLPGGVQRAAPTDIDDLLDPAIDWDELSLPFLAVIGGDESEQALMTSTKGLLNAHDPLVVDTASMLSGRSAFGPIVLDLPDIDRVGGRRVARLGREIGRRATPIEAGTGAGVRGLASIVTTGQGGQRTGRSGSLINIEAEPPWLTHSVTAGPSGPGTPDPLSTLVLAELAPPVNLSAWKLHTRKRYSIVADTHPQRGVTRTMTIRATLPTPKSSGPNRPRTSRNAGGSRAQPQRVDVVTISVSLRKLTIRVGGGSEVSAKLTGESPRVAITYDDGSIAVYVDGEQVANRSIPPGLLASMAPPRTVLELVWGPDDVAVFPTVSMFSQVLTGPQLRRLGGRAPESPLAAWVSVGSTLSRMLRAGTSETSHAGVAIRPPSMVGGDDGGIMVSPYLAFDFETVPDLDPDTAAGIVEAVSTELLAIGAGSGDATSEVRPMLTPISSKWWDHGIDASLVGEWAASVIQREVATSPVAIIRRRHIRTFGATASVAYGFDVTDTGAPPSRLGWSGHQLRTEPTRMVHAEAQFGGTTIPAALHEIDVAAPLVTDVRPVRSGALGWSGLEVVVEHTAMSATAPSGLWDHPAEARWMSLQHRVRFRDTESTIPDDFSAPATAVDTVTVDRPRLPATGDWASGRPILPAAVRYVLVGNRPGAVLDLNAMVTSVDPASELVGRPSGTITVSHRMPRPLPLIGEDQLPQIVPQQAGSVSLAPSDLVESFVLSLAQPEHATITVDNTRLELAAPGMPASWNVTAELTDGNTAVPLAARAITGGRALVGADGGSALRSMVGRSPLGTALELRVNVEPGGTIPPRTVTLPLRVGSRAAVLVDTPRFVRFRDPAYDRLLTTSAVQASGSVDDRWLVTLACDRGQYGPASPIAFGFETSIADGSPRDPEERAPGDLVIRLRRLGEDGRDTTLTGHAVSAPVQSMSMSALSGEWREGDRLILEVVRAGEVLCSITAGVLAVDPTPAPPSAYALLRNDPGESSVRCVRYAVGPRASKTEFVDLADLRTGVVRRRATFLWTDIVRGDTAARYAVQRITAGGSTHIPALDEFED